MLHVFMTITHQLKANTVTVASRLALLWAAKQPHLTLTDVSRRLNRLR